MKKFEVVDKGNTRHVLTVTPWRVTVKFKAGSSEAERKRILTFLDWVSQCQDMDETEVTFRGRTDLPPSRVGLMIQMCTESGSEKYTYYETDMVEDMDEFEFEPSIKWEDIGCNNYQKVI